MTAIIKCGVCGKENPLSLNIISRNTNIKACDACYFKYKQNKNHTRMVIQKDDK